MIRITADIDSKSFFKLAYRIYKAFKHIEKIQTIEIKYSNSKGYHLIVWTTKRYSQKKILELRGLLGDDFRRVRRDSKRPQPKQYLFYKKLKPATVKRKK